MPDAGEGLFRLYIDAVGDHGIARMKYDKILMTFIQLFVGDIYVYIPRTS
jgi:hypothetical protein